MCSKLVILQRPPFNSARIQGRWVPCIRRTLSVFPGSVAVETAGLLQNPRAPLKCLAAAAAVRLLHRLRPKHHLPSGRTVERRHQAPARSGHIANSQVVLADWGIGPGWRMAGRIRQAFPKAAAATGIVGRCCTVPSAAAEGSARQCTVRYPLVHRQVARQ
ncbi:hypothetical protein ABW21_db0208974 [Orbilia brochopaga]|nr:hypothetical protein ABW21_db0208974 [Drechslerella brochopaga]